ncbi:MAG: spore coat associated protein CotJA [Firmicutes bacterium]|nr:spore coat associated protein CotJA [Bacillota bacterium]
MCDNTVLNFCYQPPDCNECIAEHTGYAQAYVPYQESFNISSGEEALCQGTIFPDLIQPYRKDRYPKERCC